MKLYLHLNVKRKPSYPELKSFFFKSMLSHGPTHNKEENSSHNKEENSSHNKEENIANKRKCLRALTKIA